MYSGCAVNYRMLEESLEWFKTKIFILDNCPLQFNMVVKEKFKLGLLTNYNLENPLIYLSKYYCQKDFQYKYLLIKLRMYSF